ncbi:MAG: tetratricopeptide repeat protein [Candidatus Hermodarchaeota archaeon]
MLNSKAKEKPKVLLAAQELMDKGEYKEALQVLNDFEQKEELTNEDLHSYYYLKSSLLFEIGNTQEAQKFAHLAYNASQEMGQNVKIVESLILKAKLLVRQPKECLNAVVKAEDLLKTISPELLPNLKKKKASLAWIKGWAYYYERDSINALKFAERSLKLREELGNKKEILFSLNLLGFLNILFKYDLDRSLILSEHAMKIAEEIGKHSCRKQIAGIMLNLGMISAFRGELNSALDYYKQSLAILEEFEDIFWILGTLNNIALIYWRQGDVDKALELCEKNYTLSKEYETPRANSIYLSNLVALNIEIGDLEKANLYLRKLKELKNQEENEFINKIYSFFKAKLLKKSTQVGDQARAEELFKQIIERDTSSYYHIQIGASINLCDMLLVKLYETNDLKLFDEIQLYTIRIHDLAKNQRIPQLLVETFLLQAKLQLIIFDFKKAQRSLAQALHICEKYGLKMLAVRITKEQDELKNKLNKWEELKKSEAKLSVRMDLAGVGDQVNRMLKKRTSLGRY